MSRWVWLSILSLLLGSTLGLGPSTRHLLDFRLSRIAGARKARDVVPRQTAAFPVYNFTQPLDHFQNTGFTFNQRYWVSTRHYRPGGPVIVLDSGEEDATERLPYLDTGIVDILANATNGLGIVLEHRYYGESVPVENFTTDSLRWLNNEQALADSANFMTHVKFEGIDQDLTAPGTPWIYYGGSYAGARSAHMKVLYPDIVFGAIASSGVTHAALSNWGYWDIIRRAAPANCSAQLIKATKEVDGFLDNPQTNDKIKGFFGLEGLTLNGDLTSLFLFFGNWQNKNWDPAVNSDVFDEDCATMGSPSDEIISVPQGLNISTATFNLAKIVKNSFSCPSNITADECVGTLNDTNFQQTDLSQTWRLWQFQVCTQWAFFDTPPPNSSIPSVVSKYVDLEYSSKICKQERLRLLCAFIAYPPGKFFSVPPQPNINDVNRLGGYNIAHDRLAIVDGEVDPWRFDCPHSFESPSANRPDTTERPFKLIPDAVHHYDENGLADHSQEPSNIQQIHSQEISFVKAWLKDF